MERPILATILEHGNLNLNQRYAIISKDSNS